jgi:hypothetical protein
MFENEIIGAAAVSVANSSIIGTCPYSFTIGISGTIVFQNLSIGPLTFTGDSSSFVSAENGLMLFFYNSSFANITSISPYPLIIDHRLSTGFVFIYVIESSFEDLTVCLPLYVYILLYYFNSVLFIFRLRKRILLVD